MEPWAWTNEFMRLNQSSVNLGDNDTVNDTLSAREILARESRRIIDEKIATSEESTRQLKTQRNELALISRLPPEILTIIFSYVGQLSSMPIYRYIFTHVSQTWRSVALKSPTLWRELPSSIPWAREMLERSKAAGLFIRLRLAYPSPPRVLFWKDVLWNHAARIRELDLAETSKSTSLMLLEELQPSSLSLHSLQLQHSSQLDFPTFPIAVIQPDQLQSLSVTGYDGAWYSLPFSCLTNLKMHNIPSRPHLDEFIETLRGNPRLQTIDLENSLPLASQTMGSIARVNLPRLDNLRLSSTKNPIEVSNILSLIVVPSTATLEIKCRNRDSAQDDRETLIELASSLSVFFAAMSKNANVSYDNVDLDFQAETYCVRLSVWEILNLGRKRIMHLTIEPRTGQCVQETLRQIFPALPLLNIKSLTLRLEAANILVKETLRNLSCLQHVTLIGNCTPDFITALVDKPQDYYNQSSAFYSVSFPKLQTLCITATSCGPDGVCPIDYLRDCLMERYERKAELTKLTLQTCYGVGYDDVELLKEVVVDVEWDELELEDERSDEEDLYGFDDDPDYFSMDDPDTYFGMDYDSEFDPGYHLF